MAKKGHALQDLKQYEEALVAYEQTILLNPRDFFAYYGKGHVLQELERNEEASTIISGSTLYKLRPHSSLCWVARSLCSPPPGQRSI